jgi:hypothetical protein
LTLNTVSIIEANKQQAINIVGGCDSNVYIRNAKMEILYKVHFSQIRIFWSKPKNEFTTVYIWNLFDSYQIYDKLSIVDTLGRVISYSACVATFDLAS